MRLTRTAVRSPDRVPRLRVAVALTGMLVVATGLLAPLPWLAAGVFALLPAFYMGITLASGWILAIASTLALAAAVWLGQGQGAALVLAVALLAVLCGEGLRRGVDPSYLCGLLWLGGVAADLPPFAPAAAISLDSAARAVISASASAALATGVLLIIPRRSSHFPSRSRIRLQHLIFAIVVGTTALCSTAVINIQAAAEPGQSALAHTSTLAVLTLGAIVASALLGWNSRRLFRWLMAARVTERRSGPEIPMEFVAARVRAARRWQGLEREAARSQEQLQRISRTVQITEQELHKTRELMRQKTSELQAALGRIAQTAARHDALMEGSPTAALYTDPAGKVLRANLAARTLLGLQTETPRGLVVGSLIPDELILDHPLSRAHEGSLAATTRVLECRIRTPAGESREVGVQVLACGSGGMPERLILLRRTDGTKRAMAALEQARSLTRSVSSSREMFIATMSHEMRTPLHGLVATLDMMRGSVEGTEFQHQLVIARSSARALLKIANDVLDFTRIGSSQITLEKRPFGMPRILKEVMEEAQAQADTLGLTLSSSVPRDLPPSFLGDSNRIKQILGNLLSNALKFTSRGGVRLKVEYDGRQCTLDVIDTGEGVPHDKRESIFEPFVQVHARGRALVGTGLGLAICRRLSRAMHGDLVLLRSGSDGSVFSLSLPLEASQDLPPEDQSLRVFHNPKGRILVVEDNPANRYVAQALLTGLECPATIVEGGAEALELLRREEFDLILMDCQMPGMDGYETTRWARRILKRPVPIIAMTANAMAQDRKNCADAGMDDFLAKPFDRKALNEILCKWLSPSAPAPANATDSAGKQGLLPDLDETVLDELWESLQWRLEPLRQIRSTFNDSIRPILALLVSGGPAESSSMLRHLHTLLGSSGMVGARQVEHLAGRLRHAINQGRYESLPGTARELEQAMARYNREFDLWLEKDRSAERGDGRNRIAPHPGT